MIDIINLNIAYGLVYGSEEIWLQIMSTKEVKINRTECLIGGAILLISHMVVQSLELCGCSMKHRDTTTMRPAINNFMWQSNSWVPLF